MIGDSFIKRSHRTIPTLTLTAVNSDALVLGGTASEGGDVKIYRDGSNNIQLFIDADAAINAVGLDLYSGGLFRNYLTVGQAALNTTYPFYVHGNAYVNGEFSVGYIRLGGSGIHSITDNLASMVWNLVVTSGTSIHGVKLQIDANDIIVAQATGNGSGGITNKAIGLYGTTPTVQASAISDPASDTASNNAAIDSILAALRAIGLIAT